MRSSSVPAWGWRRRGFVLLAALMLLALVAVLLLGLSRRSGARAIEARDAAVQLQRQWGVRTLGAAALLRAEELLDLENRERQARNRPMLATRAGTLDMGGQRFDWVVSDEQAKVNVNTLLQSSDPAGATQGVRRLLDPSAGARVRIDPHASSSDALAPLVGWGQVFPDADAETLMGFGQRHPALTEAVTLWGDGRLNLRRTTAARLEAVAGRQLSGAQVRRIIEARFDRPQGGIEAWLATAGVSDEAREALRPLLTTRSHCHAVAIAVQNDWRRHYTLIVRHRAPERDPPAEDTEQPEVGQADEPPGERLLIMTW
jgi:type II secretory pathway component PulK